MNDTILQAIENTPRRPSHYYLGFRTPVYLAVALWDYTASEHKKDHEVHENCRAQQ